MRQARAGPELKSLHEWLHKTATTLSKKSELAKAIRYALSNWVALTRYCEDGRLEIDNNAAERALRAVALGRKNWLFLKRIHSHICSVAYAVLERAGELQVSRLKEVEPDTSSAVAIDDPAASILSPKR